ncbi:MAG: GEVED domain-containing protein, partial [Flavipsychrobacter sp.]
MRLENLTLKNFVPFCALLFLPLLCSAQNYFSESFDDITFPPAGWNSAIVSGSFDWAQNTSGSSPSCSPHSGTGMAEYQSFNASSGSEAVLITKSLDFSIYATGTNIVSFWMYRDDGYASNSDQVSVYINTTSSTSGGTLLGTINRSTSLSPTESSNGWYQYSFTIPASYSGTSNYIIFDAVSAFGNNMFLDDVSVDHFSPCSGHPNAGYITGPSHICQNKLFTLTDTSLTYLVGISYVWQSRPAGLGGAWTDISGATDNSYTTTLGTAGSTEFRVWAQCTACGTGASCTDTSNVLSIVADSFFHCYCALSTTGTPLGGGTPPTIDSVSIERTTLKNPTHYSLTAPDYYIRYKDTLNATATIRQGGHYKLFESYKGGLSYGMAWIDFDRDGIFEPSEFVNINSILANSGEASFNVPTNAALGKTGMRVRNSVINSPYDGDACTDYSSSAGAGETQDYVITIAPALGHDLGVSDITTPINNASLCANAVDSIYVNVYNFGANSESNFYVYATYTDPLGASKTIYTKYIGSLDPASTLSVFVGVINPPDAGNYSIKSYTVLSGDTVTVNDTSSINMTLKPSPDLPLTTSDTVCAGASSATVVVNKVPNVQNLWYASASDDISFSSDSAITVPYPSSDTILFVSAKGANGCETSKVPAHIVIGPHPVVDLGPDLTMCENPTFVLDAGVGDASYLWNTGDTTKTIHVTTSGTYSVNVFRYCSATDTVNVTINPLPSGKGIDYTRAGTSYLFSVAGGKDYSSLMWFFGDGDTSSQATPLHTYKTGDIRTVEVVLYNNCGTDTITWTIPTGIASLNQPDNTIKLYPNPANNLIFISTDNTAIELKDILILNSV